MTEQEKKARELRMQAYKPIYTGPSAALRMAYLGEDKSVRKAALRDYGWWMWRASNK